MEGEGGGKLRLDEAAVLHKLAALGDDELVRFLMLCSFAHYGANQYGEIEAALSVTNTSGAERYIRDNVSLDGWLCDFVTRANVEKW